ncbi:MAG: hypothetical protein MJA29_09960, partial [Candidatus Omnitrophica bacterium]|nr:hypothetical protein [Candidatus Omnitrophota bacterium]
KSKGLCFACLKSGHQRKDCKHKVTCSSCKQLHPTVLHVERKSTESVEKKASVGNSESCGLTRAGDTSSKLKVAVSIVPVRIKVTGSDRYIETYAFLDPGSTGSFISHKVMHDLHVEGKRVKVLLRTMGQEKIIDTTAVHGLEVSDLNDENVITLPDVYAEPKVPVSLDQVVSSKDVEQWPYLKDVPIHHVENVSEIGILIGNNVPQAVEPWDVVHSQANGPYAVKTVLGWAINGPLSRGCSVHVGVVGKRMWRQSQPL